jgi:hypothetical protein
VEREVVDHYVLNLARRCGSGTQAGQPYKLPLFIDSIVIVSGIASTQPIHRM